MWLLITLSLFLSVPAFATTLVEGLSLIRGGKEEAGYKILEEVFNKQQNPNERGEVAYLLALSTKGLIKGEPAYYARHALKYAGPLDQKDTILLKRVLADSFLEHGKFDQAKPLYDEIRSSAPAEADYVDYQLGYYHLNKKSYSHALKNWQDLSLKESPLKDNAKASLGRYWTSLGHPPLGLIMYSAEFLGGFKLYVEDRDSDAKVQELENLRLKGATQKMLEIMVEGSIRFVKKPCEFIQWYHSDFKLNNETVFPLLKKCSEESGAPIKKILSIAAAQSESAGEKLFLGHLLTAAGETPRTCDLAHREVQSGEHSFLQFLILSCPERSNLLLHGIEAILTREDEEYHPLLKASKVIRTSLGLPLTQLKRFIAIVSEESFIRELKLDDVLVLKELSLSEGALLDFVLQKGRVEKALLSVTPLLRSDDGKLAISYLQNGIPMTKDICSLKGSFQRLALESKILAGTLVEKEAPCLGGVLSAHPELKLHAYESIIRKSDRIVISTTVDLVQELFKDQAQLALPTLQEIRDVSAPWADDLITLIKVQDYSVRSTATSENLLKQLSALKRLRSRLLKRTWTSKVLANRSFKLFNDLLARIESKNAKTVAKLNLSTELQEHLNSMRFL